jgi:hypothetical protein
MARTASDNRFKDAALWWLDQGAALLPVQPRSKRLVTGYGPSKDKKQITTRYDAVDWWLGRVSYANMAVLVGPDHGNIFVLDFDVRSVYDHWKVGVNGLQRTYHEFTPSDGRHVFFRVSDGWPSGFDLVRGVELKTVCLVAPSIHPSGGEYKGINPGAEILTLDDWHLPFLPISLPSVQVVQPWEKGRDKLPAREAGIIDQVKVKWPILTYCVRYLPELKLRGKGQWRAGRCPLPGHDDLTPSFYVNIDSGFWICHGCNHKGDVINLHMCLHGCSTREAIFQLLDGGWR